MWETSVGCSKEDAAGYLVHQYSSRARSGGEDVAYVGKERRGLKRRGKASEAFGQHRKIVKYYFVSPSRNGEARHSPSFLSGLLDFPPKMNPGMLLRPCCQ